MAVSVRLVRTRILGVLLPLVIIGLVWLSIAFYGHKFTPHRTVYIKVSDTGHQLDVPADVKLRGIIVGEVRQITSNGKFATLKLAINPGDVKMIPHNVQIMILPKTLFGEKFIDLVLPKNPSVQTIAKDQVIDTTGKNGTTSLEVEDVFNKLVPLLRTVQPAQLNLTLSNLAEALRGNGNALGDNLARTDTYFKGLNPDIANIRTDISGLADLAANFDQATPDLLANIRQFSFNARTLVQKGDVFTNFLAGTRGFAGEATNVLTRNETNLVQLAKVSRPTLGVLAKYSPEFPCLLQGFVSNEPRLNGAFAPPAADQTTFPNGDGTVSPAAPQLHINLGVKTLSNDHASPPSSGSGSPKLSYNSKDTPDFGIIDNPNYNGPRCFVLRPGQTKADLIVPPLNTAQGSKTAPSKPGQSPADAVNHSLLNDTTRMMLAPTLGVAGSQVPDLALSLYGTQFAGLKVGLS